MFPIYAVYGAWLLRNLQLVPSLPSYLRALQLLCLWLLHRCLHSLSPGRVTNPVTWIVLTK
jgi:hypothetical protein